jgi:16S rRNA (uracil1498-N3)-methyltransferase
VSAPRFFCDAGGLAPGQTAFLSREEWRHVRSRRLADGDAIVLIDGSGAEADAVLTAGGTAGRIIGVRASAAEPRVAVSVFLAAAEPSRVEWAIEKGTECGAASFLLIAAERSQEAHVRALSTRDDRLTRIAREAVKQCGRARVPEVRGPVTLEEALTSAPPLVLAALPGAPLLADVPEVAELAIAVGPEGGFSPVEEELLRGAGALPVGLGPRTLRLETAVVALLARLAV